MPQKNPWFIITADEIAEIMGFSFLLIRINRGKRPGILIKLQGSSPPWKDVCNEMERAA